MMIKWDARIIKTKYDVVYYQGIAYIFSPLRKGRVQQKLNYFHGSLHGRVPPAPLLWKIIIFFQQFFKFLYCGIIALKHILYDSTNS